MGDEYFYGVTLSKDNKELKWEPDELKENGSSNISLGPRGDHCLVLKQAIITGGAKDELNVVEVETSGYKATTVKLPIIALQTGSNGTALQTLDLSMSDPPVILRLIKGSGPVHIAGMHVIQAEQYDDDDDDDEEEDLEAEEEIDEAEEEESPESVEEVKVAKGKKRAQSNSNGQAPASKKKKEKESA